MAITNEEWKKLSATERKALQVEQQAAAMKAVESGKFPTGLKVVVGGKEIIARPVRQTESGGITYAVSARPLSVGKYSARFNKFSLTLMGEGAGETTFEEEDLL